MKRALIILILLFLLASPTILSANDTTQVKEKLSALKGGLDDQTEDILSREVKIPDYLITPLNFIFGLKEKVTWKEFIITLGIWLGFFILIFKIIDLLPFFKQDAIRFLASIIITILVSITGALNKMALVFYKLAGIFFQLLGIPQIPAKWTSAQLILAIIFAIIALAFFIHAARLMKNKIKIEKAEELGKKLKEGSESAEVLSESLDEVAKAKVDDFEYSRGMKRGAGSQGKIKTRYKKDSKGKRIVERKGSNLFVKEKVAKRYSKMFGEDNARKRFGE